MTNKKIRSIATFSLIISLCIILSGCTKNPWNGWDTNLDQNIIIENTDDNWIKNETDNNADNNIDNKIDNTLEETELTNTDKQEENKNDEKVEVSNKNNTDYKWFFEYESKPYKFTIQIPKDWSFLENEYGFSVLLYTPEDWDLRENLGVTVQTPQIPTNLETYYKESMQKIAEISEWFKEISTSNIEVNWLKGKKAIYETVQNDTNIKSQQTVFIKDNIVYIFQYTATKKTFDKYINEVNSIITSFTFKN